MEIPPGFEWDPVKAEENFRRHGVSFEEAATAFDDTASFTIEDPEHSGGENRYILLGRSYRHRILVVVHTDRGDRIRVISAWHAEPRHKRTYEEGPE